MHIPLTKPFITGKEFDYIKEVINKDQIIGAGIFTKKCQNVLENQIGCSKALLTHSCTAALEMAALLLNIKPGDEIIVPSFTFPSTINAFVLRGARPVFIDIHLDTLNMNENHLEKHLSSRTKAIVPVHYAGVGCEMDIIIEIAQHYNVPVVEDNSHGFLGEYKGKQLGTFGCFATLSFHGTKNFTCGEGGAFLINDTNFTERAEIILEKGTNRKQFHRGKVDKYTWVDIGSSYLPSEILAAFLYAQLRAKDQIQELRRKVWEYYYVNLLDWANDNGVRIPFVPEYCKHPFHLFYLLMPSIDQRQALIKHLWAHDIQAAFHYPPLHLSAMGRKYGGAKGDLPITERVSDCLIRLPFYNELSEEELIRIIDALYEFYKR